MLPALLVLAVGVASSPAPRRCVERVELEWETVWRAEQICHASSRHLCHTSWHTAYRPVQTEKCRDNYIKDCTITFRQEVRQVVVVQVQVHMSRWSRWR